MPQYVSPGVYTIEKDISQYPPTINSSVVGLVGFASKGPTNKATLITSPSQLVDTFGPPSEGIPGQGLEGALEILEATNSMYFVRAITDASSLQASAEVPLGTCPAVGVSSVYFGGAKNSELGVSGVQTAGYSANNHGTAYFKVQVWDNNNVPQFPSERTFTITSALTAGMSDSDKGASGESIAFKSVFGGQLDGESIGAYTVDSQDKAPYIVGPIAGSGAHMSVKAYRDSGSTSGFSILTPIDPSGLTAGGALVPGGFVSSIHVYGSTFNRTVDDLYAEEGGVLFQSIYPGGGYNLGTQADGTVSGNSIEVDVLGSPFTTVQVNEGGTADETYKAGFVASGGNNLDEQFSQSTGETNLKSAIVVANAVSGTPNTAITPVLIDNFADSLADIGWALSGTWGGSASGTGSTEVTSLTVSGGGTFGSQGNARFIKMVQGTYGLAAGTNGTSTDATTQNTAIIGQNKSDGSKTGMQALNDDLLNISIANVPGITNMSIQNNLISLAESSQNFVAIVSPPYGIGGTQDAINWGNGQSAYRSAALNNSYAAAYWPWVKVFSQFDKKDIWMDPAIYGVRQMVYTDSVSEPWFAPAGYRRGRLTKPIDTEVSLNQGDRDSLYSGGNTINPIVNFPQQGITIWGQRTTQKNPSALDRINVRRLMIFVRKAVLASSRLFVFEPNDPFTWDAIVGVISPLLADIKSRRGVVDYKVVCDETTNTPARVDRNELWCKVFIKPTKAAEILIFELNLTSQGVSLS